MRNNGELLLRLPIAIADCYCPLLLPIAFASDTGGPRKIAADRGAFGMPLPSAVAYWYCLLRLPIAAACCYFLLLVPAKHAGVEAQPHPCGLPTPEQLLSNCRIL